MISRYIGYLKKISHQYVELNNDIFYPCAVKKIQTSHQQKSLIKNESLSGFGYRRRDSNPHTIASTGF